MSHNTCKEIKGASGLMALGVGHTWNLEAPHLFTRTVLAWISEMPLPQELVALERIFLGSRSEKQRKSRSSDLAHRQH